MVATRAWDSALQRLVVTTGDQDAPVMVSVTVLDEEAAFPAATLAALAATTAPFAAGAGAAMEAPGCPGCNSTTILRGRSGAGSSGKQYSRALCRESEAHAQSALVPRGKTSGLGLTLTFAQPDASQMHSHVQCPLAGQDGYFAQPKVRALRQRLDEPPKHVLCHVGTPLLQRVHLASAKHRRYRISAKAHSIGIQYNSHLTQHKPRRVAQLDECMAKLSSAAVSGC